MTEPLLSVTIPTYNRADLLQETMLSVIRQAEAAHLAGNVEVVVCDNASTDETPKVVEDLRTQTKVPIQYHRNASNLGAVRNVLRCLEVSRGRYWMLYGDDDLMADGALVQMIQLLKETPDGSCWILRQQEGQLFPFSGKERITAEEAARRAFYYLGNAGVFIVDGQAARRVLQRYGSDSFTTCWPQTQLAFLVMKENPMAESIIAAPISSVHSPNHAANTLYSSWYIWETVFYGLYRAAVFLKPFLGDHFFDAARGHLIRRWSMTRRMIFLNAAFFDSDEQVRTARKEILSAVRQVDFGTKIRVLLLGCGLLLPRTFKQILYVAGIYALQFRGRKESLARIRARQEFRKSSSARTVRSYQKGDL